MLSSAGSQLPQDADAWLNMFITVAETYPACIVISDMTIPGAPMVYVNPEFCKVTGYSKEESTGRNCRFLQGPLTEPESIAVIRNTLSKGEDCHVKLTNYRKNGDLFQNLLSMKPVFDSDGIYRYVIGVQFEVIEDMDLKARLVQLDKLLKMLPRTLPLKSRPEATAKGKLAAKTDMSSNVDIGNKDAIMAEAEHEANMGASSDRPVNIMDATGGATKKVTNFDKSIFGMSKMHWKLNAKESFALMMQDEKCSDRFKTFVERHGSILSKYHTRYLIEMEKVNKKNGVEKNKAARRLLLRKNENPTFYCSTVEITWGPRFNPDKFTGAKDSVPFTGMPDSSDRNAWSVILGTLNDWQECSVDMLSKDLWHRFLDSRDAFTMFTNLYQRERGGDTHAFQTLGASIDHSAPDQWLEIFKVASETLTVGAVAADMTIPGIPLNYINEGFKNVTGFGKEMIGSNCRFLQGPETEQYLNDEIVEALRSCESLHMKIHNYKKNNTKFQCLFILHPIFGAGNEYKYQAGLQIEFNNSRKLYAQLKEIDLFMRCVPYSLDGRQLDGYDERLAEVEKQFQDMSSATGQMRPTTNYRIPDTFEDPYAGVKREVMTVDITNRMANDKVSAGMASGAQNLTGVLGDAMGPQRDEMGMGSMGMNGIGNMNGMNNLSPGRDGALSPTGSIGSSGYGISPRRPSVTGPSSRSPRPGANSAKAKAEAEARAAQEKAEAEARAAEARRASEEAAQRELERVQEEQRRIEEQQREQEERQRRKMEDMQRQMEEKQQRQMEDMQRSQREAEQRQKEKMEEMKRMAEQQAQAKRDEAARQKEEIEMKMRQQQMEMEMKQKQQQMEMERQQMEAQMAMEAKKAEMQMKMEMEMQQQQQQQQAAGGGGGGGGGVGMGFGGVGAGLPLQIDANVDPELYADVMKKLMRPIAWVVLPGGIRCPIIPDDANLAALSSSSQPIGNGGGPSGGMGATGGMGTMTPQTNRFDGGDNNNMYSRTG